MRSIVAYMCAEGSLAVGRLRGALLNARSPPKVPGGTSAVGAVSEPALAGLGWCWHHVQMTGAQCPMTHAKAFIGQDTPSLPSLARRP